MIVERAVVFLWRCALKYRNGRKLPEPFHLSLMKMMAISL
jgi:hypothetical protein